MSSIEEIRNERIKKLERLRKEGLNPYPIESHKSVSLLEVKDSFDAWENEGKELVLSGRVMLLRHQGGMIFFQLQDGSGDALSFQGALKKDEVDEKAFSLFRDTVDSGDFLECTGTLFVTKRGEQTLKVKTWTMLAKSLRPLPEKWHGLKDTEERLRRRYLDILMSGEVRARFLFRSKLVSSIRSFLDAKHFLEVETPVLQPLYGGASAEPFITHHNALDRDLYLRISDELYLKRLLVSGLSNVYEIYKGFRNEGIDATHYPEFTMLEWYESYSDAEKQMNVVEELLRHVAGDLGEMSAFALKEEIKFDSSFKRIPYQEILEKYVGLKKEDQMSEGVVVEKAKECGAKISKEDSVVKMLDSIYKKVCKPKLIQPTFITDYPSDFLPLAKKKEGDENYVDAFQLVVGGIELVKAFSELNDPIDQRERFLSQEKRKKEGERETQLLDEDFLEAMEYGMPPAGGVGLGIDRLAMLLMDVGNIKETILFPTMRDKK